MSHSYFCLLFVAALPALLLPALKGPYYQTLDPIGPGSRFRSAEARRKRSRYRITPCSVVHQEGPSHGSLKIAKPA